MLEPALKEQLKGIFAGLEADFTFDISVSASHESRAELLELLSDVAECSDHITCMVNEGSGLKFTIGKNGKPTEIDALVGYVVMQGEKYNVATPTCGVLASLVRFKENEVRK